MSAPSTSGLSVELLLRVIDVKYGHFTLPYIVKKYPMLFQGLGKLEGEHTIHLKELPPGEYHCHL